MNPVINFNQQNYAQTFKAKMPLNDCRQFLSSPIQGTSSVDMIFKESKFVKTLNDLYVALIKNVVNTTKDQDGDIIKFLNKSFYKFSQIIRILAIKIFAKQNEDSIRNLSVAIPHESKEYIEELAKVGNSIKGKFVRINSEDRPLDNIVDSKNAAIFVLNHPNYNKDKICYTIISSLLSKLYVSKNKQADCPRPKLLSSDKLMTVLGDKLSKFCENYLGTVSINANPEMGNSGANVLPMLNLIKNFIDNKVNIFICPEGNNSLVRNQSLEERIQPGIAGIIKNALNQKNNVKIIPIGLSYPDEKNSFGNIFIGKPMFFKKINNEFVYTGGVEKKKILRTDRKNLSQTILNEICKNLKYCIQKSSELQ